MADVLTKVQRSHCMAQIKRTDTKPEIILRRELWSRGYRYRLKNSLTGKPDLVFTKQKVAIFVDGCFWHKCPEHFVMPASNREFWATKINKNVKRDHAVSSALSREGWRVLRFWEHEIESDVASVVVAIVYALIHNESSL
ncbi:MAG: very short patch repair endonuclease [Candidatus Thiodiazotropha taylori]|nr:very short patch repair endonuclease [Candidatus Thiodiazotropha taylori]